MLITIAVILGGLVLVLLAMVAFMSAVKGTPVRDVVTLDGTKVPSPGEPGFQVAMDLLSPASRKESQHFLIWSDSQLRTGLFFRRKFPRAIQQRMTNELGGNSMSTQKILFERKDHRGSTHETLEFRQSSGAPRPNLRRHVIQYRHSRFQSLFRQLHVEAWIIDENQQGDLS